MLAGAPGFAADSQLAKVRRDLNGLLYADGIHDSLYRTVGRILTAGTLRPDARVPLPRVAQDRQSTSCPTTTPGPVIRGSRLPARSPDLLRSRERLLAAAGVDGWARDEAMPSDEEISRVRRLIARMKADAEDLGEDKAQIMEAVTVVRRHRQGAVALGMPKIRQPLPDIRPDRVA